MSRESYDLLVMRLEDARADRDEAERRHAKLVHVMLDMKRDGFHPVAVVPTEQPPREDDLPGPVLDALDEIGITGSQLEQHKQWARRRLRTLKNPELVAEELLAGGLVAEEAE